MVAHICWLWLYFFIFLNFLIFLIEKKKLYCMFWHLVSKTLINDDWHKVSHICGHMWTMTILWHMLWQLVSKTLT